MQTAGRKYAAVSRGGLQLQFQQLLFGVGGAAAVWKAMYSAKSINGLAGLTCKQKTHPEWQQFSALKCALGCSWWW